MALRVYGAWATRIITDPDSGIVALMARHIAEGRHIPVFFYGQVYMGTLEPALSALFCFLLGCSGFAVNLGTVCFSAAFLAAVFLWAREAGGATAAIAALAYCAIGPASFFYFQFIPRGGYPAALFFGALAIWQSVRIAARPADPPVRLRSFLFLGIVSGLAWWTTPITTAAIFTAGIVLLIRFRLRLFSWRIVAAGLLGFVIGSAPFWTWNFANHWAFVDFIAHSGAGHLQSGFPLFVSKFGRFLGYGTVPSCLFFTGLLCYAAAVALVFRRDLEASARYALIAALVYPFLSALLYMQSRYAEFNTLRYFQPFVAPLAVLVGAATARLVRRWRYGLGWAPLLLLLLIQLPVLKQLPESARLSRRKLEEGEELTAFLRQHDTKALYANFVYYALNFQLNEEFCFSQISGEHYAPYRQCMELADRIGMIDNHGGGAEFIATAGGTSQTERVARRLVTHDFQPPPEGLVEIDPARIAGATDSSGDRDATALTDGNMDTFWVLGESGDAHAWVELRFDRPLKASEVRVVCRTRDNYPDQWRVKGETKPGHWTTLMPRQPVTTLFWSGPRPFVHGEIHRIEARFKPEKITALRLECAPDPQIKHMDISEIQVFGPAGADPVSEAAAFPDLMCALDEQKVERLYADRWVADRVHRETGGRIAASLDSSFFGATREIEHPAMTFDPHTVLLVRKENAPLCRRVLAQCEVNMHEKELPPWTLFYFEAGDWNETFRDNLGLQWMGISCLLGDSKRYALHHYASAREIYRREGPTPVAMDHLKKAVALHPSLIEPRWRLMDWAREAGVEAETRAFLAQSLHEAVPRETARIQYKNGVELLGLSISTNKAAPGERLDITYYWKCPPSVQNTELAVFVHFMKGDAIRFQDDHVLLGRVSRDSLSYQPCEEVFASKRTVRIPDDAAEGVYHIRIGLYKFQTRRRLAPATALEVQGRAVILPVDFTVKRAD